MNPMLWKMVKILLLLSALFTTIVCINSEMSKRREAAAAAAAADPKNLTDIKRNSFEMVAGQKAHRDAIKSHQQSEHVKESHQMEIDDLLKDIFTFNNEPGIKIFHTTMTTDEDDAQPPQLPQPPRPPRPFMPNIPGPNIYHQYQSLNPDEQSFKVQRSPDGKLNLVFNDPLVSFQPTKTQSVVDATTTTTTSTSQQKSQPRQPISDKKYNITATSIPRPQLSPMPINMGNHECIEGFNLSRTFCSKVTNYPDLSNFKGILSQRFGKFFSDEPLPTELGLRMDDDEQYLCESRKVPLYPRYGETLDKTWELIVNTPDFKQGILIEECLGDGKSCRFADSFPNNYVPVCKQNYITKNLVSLKESGPVNLPFSIPSCCKCVLKSGKNPLT